MAKSIELPSYNDLLFTVVEKIIANWSRLTLDTIRAGGGPLCAKDDFGIVKY